MIVDRITKYLESADRTATEAMLDVAKESFAASLIRNLTSGGQREEMEPRIRPSGPWYCPRRYHYNLTSAPKEDLTWRSRMAFLLGDTIESIAILLMRLSGVPLISPNANGVQRDLSGEIAGIPISGHIDFSFDYNQHGETVGDVKSMARYGFAEFRRACTDKNAPWWKRERFGYLFQLRIYMLLTKMLGNGDGKHGIFVGVCKDTGHMAELWVEEDEAENELIARAIRTVARNFETGHVPDRPKWAKTITMPGANILPDGSKGPCEQIDTDKARTHDHGWRCSYCPFTETCWPGFGVVALSSGPVYRKPMQSKQAIEAGKAIDGIGSE